MNAAVSRGLLVGAAAALLVGGYEHWSLYRRSYHVIPVIGVLFALNAGASAVTGAALLVRREMVVRAGGVAVALTTLGFFVASRLPGGVFNFQERGLNPAPQAAITVAAETATVVLLAVSVAWDLRSRTRLAPVRSAVQAGGSMR
jgi:hypothetical protein